MLICAAPVAAVIIALAVPHRIHHKHRPSHAAHARRHVRAVAPEAALQRTVIRMTRLAVLVRREALLREFLLKADTEAPLLRDGATHEPAPGIRISSTVVSLDLLGSPVIRARVTSVRSAVATVVLVADVVDVHGVHGRASSAIVLQPGETRIVELLCPVQLTPASLIWSTPPL